jgi:hypothetical protein
LTPIAPATAHFHPRLPAGTPCQRRNSSKTGGKTESPKIHGAHRGHLIWFLTGMAFMGRQINRASRANRALGHKVIESALLSVAATRNVRD